MALCSAAFSETKEFNHLNTLNDNRNEAGKVEDVNEESWNNNAEQDEDKQRGNAGDQQDEDQDYENDEDEQETDQESETDEVDETGEDEDMKTSNDPWWFSRPMTNYYRRPVIPVIRWGTNYYRRRAPVVRRRRAVRYVRKCKSFC